MHLLFRLDNGLAVWLGGSFHFRSNLLILQAVLLPKPAETLGESTSSWVLFLKTFFTIISKACHLIYDIRPLVHHNYEKCSSKSN